jgi:cell division protein FtsB
MQQTEKYWNLINRIVLIAVVAMAIVGIVLAFTPKVKQMQAYQNTRDTLQQRIEVTVTAEKELKEKQQRFLSDPSYVERVAHEVGYARKGEIIYHFPEETGSNGSRL